MDDRDFAALEELTDFEPGGRRRVILWDVRRVSEEGNEPSETHTEVEVDIEVGVESLSRATITQRGGTEEVRRTQVFTMDEVESLELADRGLILRGKQQIVTQDEHHAGWHQVTWYCFPRISVGT